MLGIRSRDRIKVADFGRDQTKKANSGAKKYEKEREASK